VRAFARRHDGLVLRVHDVELSLEPRRSAYGPTVAHDTRGYPRGQAHPSSMTGAPAREVRPLMMTLFALITVDGANSSRNAGEGSRDARPQLSHNSREQLPLGGAVIDLESRVLQ
jgi:hypothetical protein